jgi:His Kinase A (phospho-acceptor) domain
MTSSLDSIYKKMASSVDGASSHLNDPGPQFDPARHVSPVIAHELNNILTIVQGYAERLLMKHPDDVTLQPQLKLISEAARRAAMIIRDATPSNLPPLRPPPPTETEPEPAAA